MKYLPKRRIRPQIPPTDHAYFHIVSNIVDKRVIFGPEENAAFLSYMRRYEAFSHVRIIGYSLMDNHFHLLLQIPGRPLVRPSQESLLLHVRKTLGDGIAGQYQERIDFWEQQLRIGELRKLGSAEKLAVELASPMDVLLGGEVDLQEHAAAQLEKVSQDIWQRMYDVSQFVFSLKQQFSHWYNKKSKRVGTLWEERFRATLIQAGPALCEVAAYIDLNAVRAGVVSDAKDYPWSQYGAAAAGDSLALAALEFLASQIPNMENPNTGTRDFRMHEPLRGLQFGFAVMSYLLERRGMPVKERPGPLAAIPEIVDPLAEASFVIGPVRSFSRGLAIGDEAFLARVFEEHRGQFGPRRNSVARRIRLPDGPVAGQGDLPSPSKDASSVRVRVRVGHEIKALRDISAKKPNPQP